MADEVSLPSISQQGGGLFGVPQFNPVAPQPAETPSPTPSGPPPIPASATGATSMSDLIAGMPPAQRAIYEQMLVAQQQQQAQQQAAAAAQAGAAAKQAADVKAYLAEPRPEVYRPQYRPIPKAPEPQYRSPLEAFGSPLAALAMIGGLFTRQPAGATLGAASAAMNAQRAGDQQAFENNMATFKLKLEETLKANEQERTAYLDSWDDRKKTMDERLADIQMKASLYKNEAMASAARGGKVSDVQMQLNALVKSKEVFDQLMPSVSTSKPENQVWSEADAIARKRAAAEGKGDDPVAVAQYRKEYYEQFDPSKKGAVARSRLTHDEIMEEIRLKATLANENAEASDKRRAEARLKELELKNQYLEARDQKQAKSKEELEQKRADLRARGQLEAIEAKARASEQAAKVRADENMRIEEAKIKARAEEAQRKDARLTGKPGDTLRDTVATVRDLERMRDSFKDEYANFGFDTLANMYMWAEGRSGASPMALWWGNKEFALTMPTRHALFGATLTGGEQASWKMTDISPSMSPANIRAWFDERISMAKRKMDEQVQRLRAQGVSDENIGLVTGSYMPAPSPRITPPAGGGSIYEEFGLTPKPTP